MRSASHLKATLFAIVTLLALLARWAAVTQGLDRPLRGALFLLVGVMTMALGMQYFGPMSRDS
jgi:hypothetical protein